MTYRERSFISPIVLAAAMFAAVSGSAGAADLYGEAAPPPAYEDRRYEEIYEHPAPRAEVRQYETREYTVRERYAERRHHCLSPQEISRILYQDGWYDLDDLEIEGQFVRVEAARMNNDREFDLVLDRCSGEILEAHPDNFRHAGRFDRHHHDHRRY